LQDDRERRADLGVEGEQKHLEHRRRPEAPLRITGTQDRNPPTKAQLSFIVRYAQM